MGEDIENLQDEEVALDEGNYADDMQDDMQDDVDDLQPQEDSLYGGMVEHEAVEDGGLSGGGYYDEDKYYNYQDSNPSTDIDYRPGKDESSAYTDDYTDTKNYNPVARGDENDNEDGLGSREEENFDGEGSNFDGTDEYDNDNYGNSAGNDYDNGDDEDGQGRKQGGHHDNDEDDNETENSEQSGNSKKKSQQRVPKGSDDEEKEIVVNGTKLWKKGEPITLEVLSTHWDLFREIPEMRQYMDQADQVVEQGLNATGPNLVLKAYKSVQKIADPNSGAISILLRMIAKPSITLTYGAAAVVEAIFDQQWMQVTLIFGLKAALGVVLKMDIVKFILEKVFEKGVELYKAKLKKNKKQ